MSIIFESENRKKALREVAEKMMIAARTAPKGCGIDNLVICVAEGETIKEISNKMKEIVHRGNGSDIFERDADNILSAHAIVLIGTKIKPLGIKYCGLCGFENCEGKEKNPESPCAFNSGDLGIAVGSAVSIASDNRVDNRIMFTVGKAVRELGFMGNDVKIIYGIPLSSSGKNPFFDRKARCKKE